MPDKNYLRNEKLRLYDREYTAIAGSPAVIVEAVFTAIYIPEEPGNEKSLYRITPLFYSDREHALEIARQEILKRKETTDVTTEPKPTTP